LLKLRSERSFEISVKDISEDSHLFQRYKNIVPLIAVDGKVRLAGATFSDPSMVKDLLRKVLLPTA